MFRSSARSLVAIATAVAASFAVALPAGSAAAEGHERPVTIRAAEAEPQALSPIGSHVAAQLYWWCLDQPYPTPCK